MYTGMKIIESAVVSAVAPATYSSSPPTLPSTMVVCVMAGMEASITSAPTIVGFRSSAIEGINLRRLISTMFATGTSRNLPRQMAR